MYTSPKNLIHNRSFSFENWENKDGLGKGQSKYYYNYKGKGDQYKNEYRGDMPTFGDNDHDFRNAHRQNRKTTQYSHYDHQFKDRRDFQSRTNYSDDKWYRKQSAELRPREVDYATRQTRKDDSYSANNYRIQDSSNSAYQFRRQSRIDFERSTEQKLTNIDKINQKIKKILNTLSQEEKKISQHHLKVGNKKSTNNSYANRIKTQGDDTFQYKRDKQNDNIYSKLVGLRDRYQNQYDSSQGSAVLRQIKTVENFELTQKVGLGEKYQQSWRKEENSFAKWSRDGQDKELKSRFLQDKQVYKPREPQKFDNDKPCKLLKGTNVKSTDSLNLSTSICMKTEKDNETKDYGYKRQKKLSYEDRNIKYNQVKSPSSNNISQKYTTFKATEQFGPTQYRHNGTSSYLQNQKNDSGYEDLMKIQKSNQRWIDTIQKDQEQSPTFTSFGGNKRLQTTPAKRNLDKSLTRNDRSNKSCKLSNGKDLDEQIEKIQKKINNVENIKKQLNLEEDEQIKKSRLELNKSLSKYKEARSSADPKTKAWQRTANDSSQKVGKFGTSNSTYVAEFKTEHTYEESSATNEKQNVQKKTETNNESSEMQVCLPKPFKMCSKKTTKRTIKDSEIREIESAFMSEDRTENRKQESFKSLISHLCKQIELDTSFRNSKKWFNRKPNPSKWSDLGRELMTRRIGTNEEQNKQIFTMTEEEDNPFHTERDDEGSYAELINNFLGSQKHWIDYLQHKFIREEISGSLQEMDIDRKGNITIEDMVRYINLESDKYYRNRDLSLVFRRLSGARGQVTVDYILGQFCQ